MGCGCAGKPNNKAVASKIDPPKGVACPKCAKKMIFKQVFNKNVKGYIRVWECVECKFSLPVR